jgi:hypothetical protein
MLRRVYPLLFCLVVVLASCLPTSSGGGSHLEYNGPTEQTILRGQTLWGTNIQYIGNTPDGAQVTIGGQTAVKKTADSLDWQGSPASGVQVALTQRVVSADDTRLITAGTVKVAVDGVSPAEGQFPDKPLTSFKVPVLYSVPRGATIPGTTITYVGAANDGAELGGVSGYRYRKSGDSISWRGRLRNNVYLDVTFRVVAYSANSLQITGLATLALTGG